MTYQKDHGLPSLADVPLHIEDALMRSASDVPVGREKTKDIAKLIKEMRRLNINKRVTTTLIESGKKLVTAKVKLDPETVKEWKRLMVNKSHDDKETNAEWKQKRENFEGPIDLFISRMHLLQGDRKFKQWKGSVVDSVVGVFLTQNVSDYLSSNAFMSVAANFPANARECLDPLAYYIEEPEDVNDSILDDQEPTHIGNDDAKNSQFITLSKDSIPEVEKHEKSAKRKNKKTGIMEDAIVDWKTIRNTYRKEGSRHKMHMDSVNWNDVRLSGQKFFENIIRTRGQFRILSGRIKKFLNDEVKQNGTIDLEWLRDAPSDLVKRYLLDIEGIGLKSAECVRLLGIKHSAFPVDTNVGRIAVRLGWVPLEPLPDGIQMHQLSQYPSMDSIQQYLWPRLCKLPQETLYVLPDNHKLLDDFERRELDDPSPYLLAIWQPGETSNSFTQPKKKCDFDGSELCKKKTCSYCWTIREQSSNTFRGTILIPCRTAMRGGFPLNGTYFQTNEVFADHETSLEPVVFPREWCDGLEKRAMYCGSSVSSIFRLLDTRRIQLCFWTGFLCMRAFDRKKRMPQELVRRLHTPPVGRGAKYMHDDDI